MSTKEELLNYITDLRELLKTNLTMGDESYAFYSESINELESFIIEQFDTKKPVIELMDEINKRYSR